MHSLSVLLVTLIASFTRTLTASPAQFWQRLQQRERERQAEQDLAPIVLSRTAGTQYYPVWGNGAVLQFDEPSGRADIPSSRDYVADDYAYDVAPELVPAYNWGDETENVAAGIEEQAYKDLLMRYLLRELEKQEALPVVRRRSDRNPEEASPVPTNAPSQAATAEATTTTTSTTTASPSTLSTTSTTEKPEVVNFDRGQKEVALLRPYSENRHRSLSWPQELENHQPEKEGKTSQSHMKRVPEVPVFSTSPKKQPKQSLDILTAQLNSLRSRDH